MPVVVALPKLVGRIDFGCLIAGQDIRQQLPSLLQVPYLRYHTSLGRRQP